MWFVDSKLILPKLFDKTYIGYAIGIIIPGVSEKIFVCECVWPQHQPNALIDFNKGFHTDFWAHKFGQVVNRQPFQNVHLKYLKNYVSWMVNYFLKPISPNKS